MYESLTEATEAMIEAAQFWLTPLDYPAIASLRALAREMDANPKAATATAYGTAYRALLNRAPQDDEDDGDGLEAALKGIGA